MTAAVLKRRLLFFFLLVTLVGAGCSSSGRRPVEEPRVDRPVAGTSLQLHTFAVARPLIRVGLVNKKAATLEIRSQEGLRLLDAQARPVHRQPLHRVSFFIKGFDGVGPQTVYRVQVGSFSSETSATALAKTLRARYRQPVITPYNSQTRTWRVQVGQFSSRSEAGSFQARLRGDGTTDSLIVQDSTPVEHDGQLNAINIDGSLIAARKRFIIIPALPDGVLQVADVSYRGAVELRIADEGEILPINIVHLEEYLQGVVPAEMSSSVYPQLEALKAQALAARTYAVRNLGQYSSQGYDICNTPACQVYKGMPVEQEMTTRAIQDTRGEIITYAGKPINALFTSTSGGHTENVENVFEGDPVPYLKGVPSRPGAGTVRYFESTAEQDILYGRHGKPLNFKIEMLRKLGFRLPMGFEPDAEADRSATRAVLKRLAAIHGGEFSLAGQGAVSRMEFFQALVDAMSWRSLVEQHVHQLDVEMVFPDGDSELSFYQKRVVLYLLRFGLISPAADGSLGYEAPLHYQDLIELPYQLAEQQGALTLERGNFVLSNSDELLLEVGRTVRAFRLAEDVKLYTLIDGIFLPVGRIGAVAGDMMRVFTENDQVTILVHEPSTQGLTNDRFSRYHHWNVHYSRDELSERIARYVDVGQVVDLKPLRYGVSNRIAELEVVGTEGSAVFKGLRIRWALGLRDMLFTTLKVHDSQGRQTGWRFIGSGWGHGVGLCQVGSYGMALAGADYRQIVKHFYTGVEVEPMQRVN